MNDRSALRILVADDEPQLLRLMTRVLEREGHTVHAAPDGDEAVRVFEDNADEIDLAILDVIIPPHGIAGPLGAMVARRPDLGVILFSGDELEGDVRRQLDACGGVFLRKPFNPKALVRKLNNLRGATPAE